MASTLVSDIVWVLALIGAGTVVIIIHYVASGQMAAESTQHRSQAPALARRALSAAEATSEHEAVAAQYHGLIDDLYDLGEDVVSQRRELP